VAVFHGNSEGLVRYCKDLPYPSTLRTVGDQPLAGLTATYMLAAYRMNVLFHSKDPPGSPMKYGPDKTCAEVIVK
jgi:hypothetical protein